MSVPLADIIPEVQSLSRADKLKLIQILAEDLAGDEAGIEGGQSYPVWSPERAFSAADAMMQVLSSENGKS